MADDWVARYWDVDECCWMPSPGSERIAVPAQAGAGEAVMDDDEVPVAPV